MTVMSSKITVYLELYLKQKQGAATFDFEAGTSSSSSGAEYLFSTGSDRRQLSSTQWTSLVKSCFQRHSPTHVACPPKLLRASFVCWLRSSDTAPEVLKSGTNDKLPTHHHSRNIVCCAGSLCVLHELTDGPKPSPPAAHTMKHAIETQGRVLR